MKRYQILSAQLLFAFDTAIERAKANDGLATHEIGQLYRDCKRHNPEHAEIFCNALIDLCAAYELHSAESFQRLRRTLRVGRWVNVPCEIWPPDDAFGERDPGYLSGIDTQEAERITITYEIDILTDPGHHDDEDIRIPF